jgi:hypothetical protein
VVVVTEIQELLSCKLRAVVGDDGVRDPEAVNDIGEESHRLLRSDVGDGPDLDPF